MDKESFNKKIKHSNDFTLQEKVDIHDAKRQYPFCATLQILDVLSDKAVNIYRWSDRFLPQVALYTSNIKHFNRSLNDVNTIEITTPNDLKLKQQIEEAKNKDFSADEPDSLDVLQEINSYQEVSFKTAPKSVILSQFLDIATGGTAQNQPKTQQTNSHASNNPNNNVLETETMAKILIKQGKLTEAIEVYKKLIERFPEKSSTFADQIAALQDKLNK